MEKSLINNRRMPNCTTVVQTASDHFETEIRLNSPKKLHFSALYPTKKPCKILRHWSVKQLKLKWTNLTNKTCITASLIRTFMLGDQKMVLHKIQKFSKHLSKIPFQAMKPLTQEPVVL